MVILVYPKKKKQSDLDFPSVEGKANWDMELIKQKVFLLLLQLALAALCGYWT